MLARLTDTTGQCRLDIFPEFNGNEVRIYTNDGTGAARAPPSAVTTRARKVVEIWNARTELLFYPTFRTALAAGLPWLEYLCPACRQVGELDLREVDRHPEASISTLIPQLSCRRCCPNPPFAELIRLKARSTEHEPRRARL
jgi:hypothetical protein